jgi:hypothetical protein
MAIQNLTVAILHHPTTCITSAIATPTGAALSATAVSCLDLAGVKRHFPVST